MDVTALLEKIKEDQIKVLEFWYVDILGTVKSIAIPIEPTDTQQERLKKALNGGLHCDASSLHPGERVKKINREVLIRPDLDSYLPFPWTLSENSIRSTLRDALKEANSSLSQATPTARIFCTIGRVESGGDQSHVSDREICSRSILIKHLKKLQGELGCEYIVGPELEFYYFKRDVDGNYKSIDKGGYLDTAYGASHSDKLRKLTTLICQSMGILIEYHHHEVGKGQQEINLFRADALIMADWVLTYKVVVKEIARLFGFEASFMPKPINDTHGNGMHVHQSLWKNNKNEFHDSTARYNLSQSGRAFTAGLLAYAREITAITNQWVNSYKRLVPGYEAPVYNAWGEANRSALIRIPNNFSKKPGNVRIEYRSPDPTCNPYLAFSAMLSAGMAGVKNNLELHSPIHENIFVMPQQVINERQIEVLPSNLGDALAHLRKSQLMENHFGKEFIDTYLELKLTEWHRFSRTVTDYELSEMFRLGL